MTTPPSPSVGGRVIGTIAVVTGAAAGIGQATALLLAQEGATVIATDRDLPGAQATYDAICAAGGAGTAYALDVTEEQQWIQVLDAVVAQFGHLDLLVNNAGMSFAKDVTDMTLAEWRQVMTVNLDSVFLGTSYAIRAMRQGSGGVIINIASASGLKASPGASAYCASKAAVRMFAKAVALECAQRGDGIRVNTIFPSGVMTPLWQGMPFWEEMQRTAGSVKAVYQTLAQAVPLKRFAMPSEIAEAVVYLASEAGRFYTASDLVIDGGFTA